MAVIGATDTRSAALIENIGKDVFVITVTKTNITSAELTTIVENASILTTVIAVKCAAAFVSGTTDVINLIVEGVDIADDSSDALGVTGAASTHAAGFEV
jgi:hypothetical protein